MRERARKRLAPVKAEARTLGQRAADGVAATLGSWGFVICQSFVLGLWIIWNAASGRAFDPYPFILLNLALSFQAAYSGPIIMMSQNRQSEIDRQRAIDDYDVNCKAELEIETLRTKIDLLREQEIVRLSEAVDRLTKMMEARG
ncbi:MAG: DUF1003 domain-containing protein [Pseudomonadota bacterium]